MVGNSVAGGIEATIALGNHQATGAGQRQDAPHLMLAVDEGDVAGHRADGRQSQVKDQERRPVRKLDDHHVSLAEAEAPEPVGNAAHTRAAPLDTARVPSPLREGIVDVMVSMATSVSRSVHHGALPA